MKRAMDPRPIDRSYINAIEMIKSRRRQGRPTEKPLESALQQIPDASGLPEVRGTPSIVGMKQWLYHVGHSAADINRLNIIHVAGTKGKGSTCAWTESFLRAFGKRTKFPQKTGLYTSPHLIFLEERIRINFKPIKRELFAKYFFEVWDALNRSGLDISKFPRFLQLFSLVAFHTFIKEGVDAAIFETHNGGEFDATNIIERPVVTIITPLGFDHVKQLGPTIQNIAWHKAGIFKAGAHALSAPQEAEATQILQTRASERDIDLQFVNNDSSLPTDAPQLKPEVQRVNCSLALASVRTFLKEKAPKGRAEVLPSDISQGVDQFIWPGRFQHIQEGRFDWFLDGAHNEMSITKAGEWFIQASQEPMYSIPRLLIFGQLPEARDPAAVLERLADCLQSIKISHVIFTTYARDQNFDSPTAYTSTELNTTPQKLFAEAWRRFQPDSQILHDANIQSALETVRNIGKGAAGVKTLITGSQHLVGGALFHLGQHEHVPRDAT